MKGDGEGTLTPDQIKMYHSATATCMFMMQWLCPNIFNAVRGLARHVTAPREAHVRALMTLLKYVTHTTEKRSDSAKGLMEHGIQVQDTWSIRLGLCDEFG
jgi:hypothetical protein